MTQVSKFKIDKKVYDEIFNNFLQVITDLGTREKAILFLDNFLTKTEKMMFSKRLAIGILISKGYTYRDISFILKVSTGTVHAFSTSYKYNDTYKKVIDKITQNKDIEEFLLNIADKITKTIAFGGKGSYFWKEVNNKIKSKKSKMYQ